jgi:hypothetical protein
LAIPRAGGVYKIPPINFAYYDIKADAYKVVNTPEYTLNIARSNTDEANTAVVNNYVNKEDIQQLSTDIRYIDTNKAYSVQKKPLLIFGSTIFWICYLIPFLVAVVLFIIFRKRIKENADLARVRYKKANKVAQRRLKMAEKLLRDNQKERFYEEIERAAWSYLSDRLYIPTSELNKENISQILADKGVSEDLINRVNHVLSTAQFARYAPVAEHAMQEMYDETTQLINDLEGQKL